MAHTRAPGTRALWGPGPLSLAGVPSGFLVRGAGLGHAAWAPGSTSAYEAGAAQLLGLSVVGGTVQVDTGEADVLLVDWTMQVCDGQYKQQSLSPEPAIPKPAMLGGTSPAEHTPLPRGPGGCEGGNAHLPPRAACSESPLLVKHQQNLPVETHVPREQTDFKCRPTPCTKQNTGLLAGTGPNAGPTVRNPSGSSSEANAIQQR